MSLPSLHLLDIGAGPPDQCSRRPGPCARTDGPQSAAALQTDIYDLPRELWAYIFNYALLYLGAPDKHPAEVLGRYDHMCSRFHEDDHSSEELYIILPIISEMRKETRAKVDEAYCRAALVAIFDAYKWTAFLEAQGQTELILVGEQPSRPIQLVQLRHLASLHEQLYADEYGKVPNLVGRRAAARGDADQQQIVALFPHLRFGHTKRIGEWFRRTMRSILAFKAATVDVGAWSPQRLVDGTKMFSPDSYASRFQGIGICNWTLGELQIGRQMFANCVFFQPTDITNWNLGKLKVGDGMFAHCESFNPEGIETLDLSNLESAEYMFAECLSIRSFDISKWNLGKLTNGKYMFWVSGRFNPTGLESLDLSQLESAEAMFRECISLAPEKKLGWKLASLTNATEMFHLCRNIDVACLEGLEFPKLPYSGAKTMFGYIGQHKLNSYKTCEVGSSALKSITFSTTFFDDVLEKEHEQAVRDVRTHIFGSGVHNQLASAVYTDVVRYWLLRARSAPRS